MWFIKLNFDPEMSNERTGSLRCTLTFFPVLLRNRIVFAV